MSNRKDSNQAEKDQSRSTVTVVESETTRTLLPMEENVVRMRHGLSEGDDHLLAFALGASEETKLRLALMEKSIYSEFYSDVEEIIEE